MTELHLPKNLIYVCDSEPGFARKRKGSRFVYTDWEGKPLTDQEVIKRIQALVIPPAWKSVWICPKPEGHLQATGRDDKKRKQYRYHPLWNLYASENKYSQILQFADQLPTLRKRFEKDLKRADWDKQKVLGLATALIDELFLRVGNSYYSKTNKTYGLTTLRRKHMVDEGHSLQLNYVGKKGIERKVKLTNRRLTRLLRECSELPGHELFRYSENGSYHSISSSDINLYLNEHLTNGLHITAKNFRTWGGTVLCVFYADEARQIHAENPRKKFDTILIGLVAKEMGNTVTVCRKYYIHPKVLAYCAENPDLIPSNKSATKYAEFEPEEQMVLEILNG